ncbi:MAG: histidine triad nucleotide-binding protein [Clostridia bacterium]|jgi:histidine triad (HIT) family protein|nr:histidine triad nucleotide-binding protein [Clostridia bacterium]MBQ8418912.1 histidine triad nucleotide-binding protein [Clostridia bacterium]
MNCLFCKIIAGEIPSAKVYEDEKIFAFKDINPQAPVHVLVIPKMHIACVDEITEENSAIVAHIFQNIPKIAKLCGLENGYRVISNCGDDACQTVKHLHFHVIGGAKLAEKMA